MESFAKGDTNAGSILQDDMRKKGLEELAAKKGSSPRFITTNAACLTSSVDKCMCGEDSFVKFSGKKVNVPQGRSKT